MKRAARMPLLQHDGPDITHVTFPCRPVCRAAHAGYIVTAAAVVHQPDETALQMTWQRFW
jgi:hypothetical protein